MASIRPLYIYIHTYIYTANNNQLVVLVSSVDALTRELHSWMSFNRLCLNSVKTQLIWLGTRQQLLKLDLQLLVNRFPSFTYSSSVRDLGVILNYSFIFSDYISTLNRSCYFHLRRLRAIRRSISLPSLLPLYIHSFALASTSVTHSIFIYLP